MPGFVGTRIELVLAGAITTTNPHFTASYVDIDNTNGTAVPGCALGQTNGVTSVVVYTNTTGTVVRVLKFLSVFNTDTVAVTVTVQYNVSGTITKVMAITLQPGEQLRYDDKRGFKILTAQMASKIGSVSRLVGRPDFLRPSIDAANLTATITGSGSNTGLGAYLGTCPRRSVSIDVLFRVTTAGVTIGAGGAEIGIYRGVPFAASGNGVIATTQSIQMELLGTASLATVVTSLGIKKVNIPLTIAANPGDELYVVIHTQFTTKPVYRGALADDLTSGLFVTSSFNGTFAAFQGQAWLLAIQGAAIVPPWIAAYVN